MQRDKTVILKTMVGSRAHGLHAPDSDYDYRAVYVEPTSKILSIGHKYKGTNWCEGEVDNTAYEIGHFLKLATQCNPTILEVFRAPIVEANEDGHKLRELFDSIWHPKRCFDAFVGYGLNQRKKFLDKKDNRQNKFAVAYVRTLYQLGKLLKTGKLEVEIKDPALKNLLLQWRNGEYGMGAVIDIAEAYINEAKLFLADCYQKPDLKKANEFLVDIRRRYW
jgi:hypothetical protein